MANQKTALAVKILRIPARNISKAPYGPEVKYPLFRDEVLVHEATESVGIAKITYYPIDGSLKGILIGLELSDGSKRDFPLIELRQASPEEEKTLQFVAED